MKLYTSYFDNIPNIPEDIHKISITGKDNSDLFNWDRYPKLAPKRWFWKQWYEKVQQRDPKANDFYIQNYEEQVLSVLNANEVLEDIKVISNCKDAVLLCFETPDKFCHRHIVSKWFNDNSIDCEEYRWE